MTFERRAVLALFCMILPAVAGVARADEQVILTVIRADDVVEYTIEDLRSLEEQTFRTETIWSSGLQEFKGVPLKALLDDLGVSQGWLKARAINDYAVDVPVSDAVENGPIIAYERNGTPMSVRDKGPLWLVYPFDSNPDYRTEVIYSRSIWQLDRLEVLP